MTMQLPVWRLETVDGTLVATVRASSAQIAAAKFQSLPEWAREGGGWVRRQDDNEEEQR